MRLWKRQQVLYPFRPTPRIAVVSPPFAKRLRRCEAIAGPVGVLVELAEAVKAGKISVPPLDAVIPFTGVESGTLSEQQRELLWRVFQAPIFEQLRDAQERVLAMECEAHEGLHVVEDCKGNVDTGPCACGQKTPRLMPGTVPGDARSIAVAAR